MKLYPYCFAAGLERLNRPPLGVSGARVRLIPIDDITAVVSLCRGKLVPVTRKNAIAHSVVVRSVFNQTTPLPFRFGTLITEEELRSYVKTHRQALKARLTHVRGCAEMSVRVSGPRPNAPPALVPAPGGPGTRFLLEKRKEFRGEEWRTAQKAELSGWLAEKVGKLIRDEQINSVPTERAVLARVDHLVERGNVPEYRTRMATAIAERPETRFMVSGPWPPYSFANIELEFSSQFGVS
jgi:hypothetical protein